LPQRRHVFQICGAATAKARLPTVVCLIIHKYLNATIKYVKIFAKIAKTVLLRLRLAGDVLRWNRRKVAMNLVSDDGNRVRGRPQKTWRYR